MKMKSKFILAITLLAACGCAERYTIDGTITCDTNLDGEKIYLVPLEGASHETVDSTIIEKSGFRFEGSLDKEEACVIRVRPAMRKFAQELLVIKEAGTTTVEIGMKSRTSGTPQNDTLQQWKSLKERADAQLYELYNLKKSCQDTLGIKTIESRIDSINNRFRQESKAIKERNKNTFGELLKRFGL